jgi:DUF1365 family protein
MNSALYKGKVAHRRTHPVQNTFSYSVFMVYLDLSELEHVFNGRWLWSIDRFNIATFNRSYHLGDPDIPLEQAVRGLVEERLGSRPEGPVRMLTQMRYFGYNFNPVSFYYCFNAEDRFVETIIVEIHNTPWGEMHCYVLGERENLGDPDNKRFEFAKAFHISPFTDMDTWYDWRFGSPGNEIDVHMKSFREGNLFFEADMTLKRYPITGRNLSFMLIRYPVMTGMIVSAIYWQALRLKVKGAPFYTHPAKRGKPEQRELR